jgi:hypothetical protein
MQGGEQQQYPVPLWQLPPKQWPFALHWSEQLIGFFGQFGEIKQVLGSAVKSPSARIN